MNSRIGFIRLVLLSLFLAGFIPRAEGQDECIRAYGATDVERFLVDLQHSVALDDRIHIAGMIRFPIKILVDSKPLTLHDKQDFLKYYDVAMDSRVKGFIRKQKFSEFFCNWQGIMIGRGEIWINSNG